MKIDVSEKDLITMIRESIQRNIHLLEQSSSEEGQRSGGTVGRRGPLRTHRTRLLPDF